VTSDNLRNQMYWKWFENDWVPEVRVDRAPLLLHAGAGFVVAFELSFFLLAAFRKTRLVALACGLAFHLVAQAILKIPFLSLWGCYVVLVDWERNVTLRRFFKNTASRAEGATGHPWPAIACGVVLLAGAIVQGARGQMRSFPLACYPTFQFMVGDEIPDLYVEAIGDDGSVSVVPPPSPRTQRSWGALWSLAGVSEPAREDRLRAYFIDRTRGTPFEHARRARFYRAYYSVIPEDRGAPPRRKELLFDVAVGP
jgi:hypothetical protein